jgi:ribosomal protein S18 acetylase RimI-like enzyme
VIIVREARADEYARAGDLTVEAYAALPGDHLADGYDALLRDAARRAVEAVLLVAVDDGGGGGVVGCVTYVPGAEYEWAEGLGEDEVGIRMLAVDPAAQSQGAGEALVRACIERARAAGKRAVFLHSTGEMAAAHRLYGRLGFSRVPDRNFQPTPTLQLFAFRLDLGGSLDPMGV